MILLLVFPCLFADSYECTNYVSITDSTRNVNYNFGDLYECDADFLRNTWYRFRASGNEMVPTDPPELRMCDTLAPGYQSYSLPTDLYQTTSGNICYKWK